MQDPKNRHLGTTAQLCWAISSQLGHASTIRKKIVKQQYLTHMSPQYGELRPTSGWDRFVSLGHPYKFQWVSCLGSVTARHSSSGQQLNFVALNRGRHPYLAGRLSRLALAHISSSYFLTFIDTSTSRCNCAMPFSVLTLVRLGQEQGNLTGKKTHCKFPETDVWNTWLPQLNLPSDIQGKASKLLDTAANTLTRTEGYWHWTAGFNVPLPSGVQWWSRNVGQCPMWWPPCRI